jgi:uncharacterized YccA/Bax inhibitor family protein
LNLALDVAVIEKRGATGSPKFMEWYRAFGPMVAPGGSAGKS